MRIVVDTNRIVAALIKAGISREIIFNNNFEFFIPDHSIIEIKKYKEIILDKAEINKEEFDI